MSSCRTCEHDRTTHQHFRPGSDCSRCECSTFRRPLFWRRPGHTPDEVTSLTDFAAGDVELSRTA